MFYNQILGYVALDKRRVKNVFMWNLPDGRERQVTFENRDVIGKSPFSCFRYDRPAIFS